MKKIIFGFILGFILSLAINSYASLNPYQENLFTNLFKGVCDSLNNIHNSLEKQNYILSKINEKLYKKNAK